MKTSFLFAAGCLFLAAPLAFAAPPTAQKTAPVSPWSRALTGEKRASHLLNRLAFGPRPGDVEAIQQSGEKKWIEQQLAPQTLDDSALETRLSSLKWLRATPAELQLAYEADTANFLRLMKRAEAGEIAAPVLTPRQQESLARIEAAALPPRASVQALGELSTAKLARAIESKRQLQEVLADFWSNHFNVDVKKNAVRGLKIVDDRETIRPHVMGSFRAMLGASAHSPAMMLYLDNARSTREAMAPRAAMPGARRRGGINENYARELMELHTLGVDGGYSQADVTEVARAFTGWSVEPQTGEWVFRPRAHDQGPKTVMGKTINAGGEADGEAVLDLLAAHPATARFIARKLCQRFVADEPPAALTEKVARAFLQSKGDLPTTYRALFFAPEFLSEGAYRAKIKSPLEFTVSAVRALGGTLEFGDGVGATARLVYVGSSSLRDGAAPRGAAQKAMRRPLGTEIAAMGQPLFSCQAPTGYSEKSSSWVSSSALVARLNFALSLTQGRIGDV
ncbi:MAG TPA: DUF1800 domain-containing protein, partial [Abditibacterium sp.]